MLQEITGRDWHELLAAKAFSDCLSGACMDLGRSMARPHLPSGLPHTEDVLTDSLVQLGK